LYRLLFFQFGSGGVRPCGPVRKRGPSGFGSAATLAHEVERCRFQFCPRLCDAGEIELQLA
jgi:hypothetical protein